MVLGLVQGISKDLPSFSSSSWRKQHLKSGLWSDHRHGWREIFQKRGNSMGQKNSCQEEQNTLRIQWPVGVSEKIETSIPPCLHAPASAVSSAQMSSSQKVLPDHTQSCPPSLTITLTLLNAQLLCRVWSPICGFIVCCLQPIWNESALRKASLAHFCLKPPVHTKKLAQHWVLAHTCGGGRQQDQRKTMKPDVGGRGRIWV